MKTKILLFFIFISLNTYAQIGFDSHVILDEKSGTNKPIALISGDLDGDGDLDILSASSVDDKIAWYENLDGQGTFGIQRVITTDVNTVNSVDLADFDNDGDLDVLSGSKTGFNAKVVWFENIDGLGSFSAAKIIGILPVQAVRAADLDGDGDQDAIIASTSKITWHENTDGQGTFGPAKIITDEGVTFLNSLDVSDLDNDGDLDVLSTSSGNFANLAWYENTDGQGTFGDQFIIAPIRVESIYTQDLDNDGDEDIVASQLGPTLGRIWWYENVDLNGQDTFINQQILSDDLSEIPKIYTQDLDNDGDYDILFADYYDDKIGWYENTDGEGTFGEQMVISADTDGAEWVYTADVDGDGDQDVLSTSSRDDKIAWYENLGQGEFSVQNIINELDYGTTQVIAADMDNDGDIDALSASAIDDKIAWYENIGGNTFGIKHVITRSADSVRSVLTSDLDGDGDLDVISASFKDDKIAWYENLDQGVFGAPVVISTDADGATSVYVTDLDNDGDPDILSASFNDDKIAWYENIGQGTFGPEKVISNIIDGATSVRTSDLDGDGDQDVLAASFNDDKIIWRENFGQGSFGPREVISADVDGLTSIYTADLDGDGDQDIVSAASLNNRIAWHENIGQGIFNDQRLVTSNAGGATSVYTADLDGDGDQDILSASFNDDKIAWYENAGQGVFGRQQLITKKANGATSVYAFDMDGDGDQDVLSASMLDHKIAWYENLGLTSNKVNGFVYLDVDDNACATNAMPLKTVMININNDSTDLTTFSLESGFYQFFIGQGMFTTSVMGSDYYTLVPEFYTHDFLNIGEIDTANFCFSPNQTVNDLNVSLFPTLEARPGFKTSYQLIYRNEGTTELNGAISLKYDNSKLSFLEASEFIFDQTTTTLVFEFDDLLPLESRTIDLNFQIFEPPIANNGDEVEFLTTIFPLDNDENESDNVFSLEQTLIGSFDPNDIRVLEGPTILPEEVDNYLHYIIRFQNTGTASAVNVRVENPIDEDLDWSTLQIENTSHRHETRILNGNEITFMFNGIYLPDSTTNEPESHGFIAYKVKPKANFALGDVIYNYATIFFDFNEPVYTNGVSTRIAEPLDIKEPIPFNFSIHPVPTSSLINIITDEPIEFIEIYNHTGQLMKSVYHQTSIDVTDLVDGVYLCKVVNARNKMSLKRIIKIE